MNILHNTYTPTHHLFGICEVRTVTMEDRSLWFDLSDVVWAIGGNIDDAYSARITLGEVLGEVLGEGLPHTRFPVTDTPRGPRTRCVIGQLAVHVLAARYGERGARFLKWVDTVVLPGSENEHL